MRYVRVQNKSSYVLLLLYLYKRMYNVHNFLMVAFRSHPPLSCAYKQVVTLFVTLS